jgi:hypothetical protein
VWCWCHTVRSLPSSNAAAAAAAAGVSTAAAKAVVGAPREAGSMLAGRGCRFPAEAHHPLAMPAPFAPSCQVRRTIPAGELGARDHGRGSCSGRVVGIAVGEGRSGGGRRDAACAAAPAGQLGVEAAV